MASSSRMSAGARREQLLDVCTRVVDIDGFHAATLERVANEAGVSRTVLYQHFGGLDGLLDALVERATERAFRVLVDATADWSIVSPAEAMQHVLRAVDADPATWRMFLVLPPAGPPSLAAALERARTEIRRYVVKSLYGEADGASDPDLAARMLQVVADELVRLRLGDPAIFTHERLLTQYESMVTSLLAHPVQPDRSADD